MKLPRENNIIQLWAILFVASGIIALLTFSSCRARTLDDSIYRSQPVDQHSLDILEVAPDFEFVLYEQSDHLRTHKQMFLDFKETDKPIILNFWAVQCPPCWSEMPDLQDFHEAYEDKIAILGLDVGRFTNLGGTENPKKLLDRLNVTYSTGYPSDGNVVIEYGIVGMPTTVFITSTGKIFRKWTGTLNKDDLASVTNEMLQSYPASN